MPFRPRTKRRSRCRSLPCQTFLLRFLLEGRAAEPSGGYKTFREMPWGEMYIGPYTGRVLTRAAFTFGTRVEKFRAACEKPWAHWRSRTATRASSLTFWAATGCSSWSTPETKNSRPAVRSCTRTTFETGFAAEDPRRRRRYPDLSDQGADVGQPYGPPLKGEVARRSRDGEVLQ